MGREESRPLRVLRLGRRVGVFGCRLVLPVDGPPGGAVVSWQVGSG